MGCKTPGEKAKLEFSTAAAAKGGGGVEEARDHFGPPLAGEQSLARRVRRQPKRRERAASRIFTNL